MYLLGSIDVTQTRAGLQLKTYLILRVETARHNARFASKRRDIQLYLAPEEEDGFEVAGLAPQTCAQLSKIKTGKRSFNSVNLSRGVCATQQNRRLVDSMHRPISMAARIMRI